MLDSISFVIIIGDMLDFIDLTYHHKPVLFLGDTVVLISHGLSETREPLA